MKKNLILFLKGVVIGIGKIIPGVSGAMLAISLGVYEELISAMANIIKINRQKMKFLIIIGLGIVLSIMLSSKVIVYLLNNYYLSTMLLFIGMITGCIPNTLKTMKKTISKKNVILLIIPFIILLLLSLISNNELNIKINFFNLILIGIVEAFTMIIPGISGSAVLMLLGVYEVIINSLSSFENLAILIPFLIGIVLGVLMLSKIISKLLLKYKISCYYVILGFTVTSIFILLGDIFTVSYSFYEIFKGMIFFIFGFYISYKLD